MNSLMVMGVCGPRIWPERPRSGPEYDVVRTLVKPHTLFAKIKLRRWMRKERRAIAKAEARGESG